MRERSVLPIVADESCLVSTDIPALDGAVDGINIKLAKCGGLREALRMQLSVPPMRQLLARETREGPQQ